MTESYFKFFYEWGEYFEELTEEEVGMLVLAIMRYMKTGEEPELQDRSLRIVWKSMRGTLDRTTTKAADRSEINRENGKKGGAPKGNRNASKTSETTENKQKQPKTSETSHTNTNTNTNTNTYTYTEEDTRACAREATTAPARKPVRDLSKISVVDPVGELSEEQILEIIDLWNSQELTKQIFNIHRLSARENNTRLCIGRVGFDDFLLTIGRIDQQAFFKKTADEGNPVKYDWFVRPDNFQKVLEGNYSDDWQKQKSTVKKSAIEEWEES